MIMGEEEKAGHFLKPGKLFEEDKGLSKKERVFERKFDIFDKEKFEGERIYKLLKEDIESGEVFPALRVNRIDFYYEGGCILNYKSNGFFYNHDYLKYMGENYTSLNQGNYLIDNKIGLKEFYEDLKKGVSLRHTLKSNKSTERQILSQLDESTFKDKSKESIVLDVEIRFNKPNGKKCDLLLYNNKQQKLMLVEAKMEYNPEIKSKAIPPTPKVIDQVKEYSSWLTDRDTIKKQYSNYIEFINYVFGTNLNKGIKDICKKAKLIVFEKEKELDEKYKPILREELGSNNVLFTGINNVLITRSSETGIDIDKIWNELDE